MQTIRLQFTNSFHNIKINAALYYFFILVFIALATFISSSISQFINQKMSITIEPSDGIMTENSQQKTQNFSEVFVARKGDTLEKILSKKQFSKSEIINIIKTLKENNLIVTIRNGQKIIFNYKNPSQDNYNNVPIKEMELDKIVIFLDKTNRLNIIKTQDGFRNEKFVVPLHKKLIKLNANINANFISTLKTLGLSNNNIVELINAYSYQIDFQRQIKHGDSVSIIVEKFVTEDKEYWNYGKILYASLKLSEHEYKIYRYTPNKNDEETFFSENGKSVKRSLLKTPLKLARVSSHFGNRQHPILGYTKMHTGVDFVAAVGTPIYAAGSGKVVEMCWKSGYGRWIRIKHNNNLSTGYAHASRFAKNLKVGSFVKQGQIIAYVGSSGRATGPHLHYEVKVGGKNVNPMKVKSTPGKELFGKQLANFKIFRKDMNKLIKELDTKT